MHLGISVESLQADSTSDVEALLQANAFYRLLIIQKAMNNGVLHDEDGWSYYPYWVLYSKKEMERISEEEKQRKVLSSSSTVRMRMVRRVRVSAVRLRIVVVRIQVHIMAFPLCFNSEEAALYAAEQFEDLFFQYYGIIVKS